MDVLTKGAEEVSVEDATNGVQLLSFTSAMGIGSGGSSGSSFSMMEVKFKFHVKEPLRQVIDVSINPLARHPGLAKRHPRLLHQPPHFSFWFLVCRSVGFKPFSLVRFL